MKLHTFVVKYYIFFLNQRKKNARAHNTSLNSRCFRRELFQHTFHARKTYHFSKSRPRKGKTNENAELIQILYTNVPYIEPYITHFVYCRYCASWIRLISTRIILRKTFAPNWPFSNINPKRKLYFFWWYLISFKRLILDEILLEKPLSITFYNI